MVVKAIEEYKFDASRTSTVVVNEENRFNDSVVNSGEIDTPITPNDTPNDENNTNNPENINDNDNLNNDNVNPQPDQDIASSTIVNIPSRTESSNSAITSTLKPSSSSNPAKKLESKDENSSSTYYVIIGSGVVIVIIALVFLFLRKKRKNNNEREDLVRDKSEKSKSEYQIGSFLKTDNNISLPFNDSMRESSMTTEIIDSQFYKHNSGFLDDNIKEDSKMLSYSRRDKESKIDMDGINTDNDNDENDEEKNNEMLYEPSTDFLVPDQKKDKLSGTNNINSNNTDVSSNDSNQYCIDMKFETPTLDIAFPRPTHKASSSLSSGWFNFDFNNNNNSSPKRSSLAGSFNLNDKPEDAKPRYVTNNIIIRPEKSLATEEITKLDDQIHQDTVKAEARFVKSSIIEHPEKVLATEEDIATKMDDNNENGKNSSSYESFAMNNEIKEKETTLLKPGLNDIKNDTNIDKRLSNNTAQELTAMSTIGSDTNTEKQLSTVAPELTTLTTVGSDTISLMSNKSLLDGDNNSNINIKRNNSRNNNNYSNNNNDNNNYNNNYNNTSSNSIVKYSPQTNLTPKKSILKKSNSVKNYSSGNNNNKNNSLSRNTSVKKTSLSRNASLRSRAASNVSNGNISSSKLSGIDESFSGSAEDDLSSFMSRNTINSTATSASGMMNLKVPPVLSAFHHALPTPPTPKSTRLFGTDGELLPGQVVHEELMVPDVLTDALGGRDIYNNNQVRNIAGSYCTIRRNNRNKNQKPIDSDITESKFDSLSLTRKSSGHRRNHSQDFTFKNNNLEFYNVRPSDDRQELTSFKDLERENFSMGLKDNFATALKSNTTTTTTIKNSKLHHSKTLPRHFGSSRREREEEREEKEKVNSYYVKRIQPTYPNEREKVYTTKMTMVSSGVDDVKRNSIEAEFLIKNANISLTCFEEDLLKDSITERDTSTDINSVLYILREERELLNQPELKPPQ